MSGDLGQNPLVLYNWNPATQLANYLTAQAAVVAGQAGAIARIVALGDSTTVGVGDTMTNAGYRDGASYPTDLAHDLAADGVPAQSDDFLGGQTGEDSRVTLLGDAAYSAVPVPGSHAIAIQSAGSGFAFAPTSSGVYNQLQVSYVDVGTGAVTVSVDGGTATTLQLQDTQQITTRTIAVPPGLHATATVVATTSTPVYLVGAAFADAAAPSVQVYNAGAQGSESYVITQHATIDGAPYPNVGQLQGVVALSPNLVLIDYGINDINGGVSTPAQTAANIAAAVTTLQADGIDSIIIIPEPFLSPTYATELPVLRADLQAVATTLNVPIIDLSATLGDSFAAVQAAGLISDSLHPNATFYADIASDYAKLLTGAAAPETLSVNDSTLVVPAQSVLVLTGNGNAVTASYNDLIDLAGNANGVAASVGDTVYVSGDDAVVTSRDTIGVFVQGNHASIAAGAGTVEIQRGTGEAITLSHGVVTLADGTGTLLTGAGNAVTAGHDALVGVVGDGNQVMASAGDTVNVAGNGAVIASTDGLCVNLQGDDASITAGAGSIDIQRGTGEAIKVSNAVVVLGDATSALVTGSGDVVTAGAYAMVGLVGDGNHVAASAGDMVNVVGDDAVIAGANATGANAINVNLEGNGASITARASWVQVHVGTAEAIIVSDSMVTLQDATGAAVTGSGNTIGLGVGVSVAVTGSGNQVQGAAQGPGSVAIDAVSVSGSANMVFLGSGPATVADLSSGLTLVVSGALPPGIVDRVSGFGAGRGGVVELNGGAGGYASATAALAALIADGQGGSVLAVGAAAIDFTGVAPASFGVANFRIG